jgi:hypothetical protein
MAERKMTKTIIIKFYLKSILIKHYNTSSSELFKIHTFIYYHCYF